MAQVRLTGIFFRFVVKNNVKKKFVLKECGKKNPPQSSGDPRAEGGLEKKEEGKKKKMRVRTKRGGGKLGSGACPGKI